MLSTQPTKPHINEPAITLQKLTPLVRIGK